MEKVHSFSQQKRIATGKPVMMPLDKDLENVVCPCGNQLFEPKMLIKKIPPSTYTKQDGFLNGEEEYKLIDVMICTKCGKDPSRKNNIGLPEELCYPPLEEKKA